MARGIATASRVKAAGHRIGTYLSAHRYTVVIWNSVPVDWEGSGAWVRQAVADIERRDWTLLVLHHIEGGAANHLADFLDAVSGEVALVRDFPPDCVPMIGGVPRPGLDGCRDAAAGMGRSLDPPT
jgi:hypothetical protein